VLKAGYSLHVYNRSASKAEVLVAAGARQGMHPGDVVEPGCIVMTMVANDAALESVTLGDNGILARLGPGGIHVSMSTVSPALARKMAELHAQHGCTYVAAPVLGRPDAAAAGKLWVCVAGESGAKERVHPLLRAIGQGIFDFGEDPSKANVVKLCGNFLVIAAIEAMAEALALAEKNGIDRGDAMKLIQTLYPGPVYQKYGDMIAEKRYTPVGFQMVLGLKDVNLMLGAAEEAHMPMPIADLVHNRLITGVAKGRSEMDWSALAQLVGEDAGIE
jgi:3-hydroxyisobutyrate dehydrogenase-like beta-hydroxyacid dehydrogenase